MTAPEVSVVMSVHNSSRFLQEAIDSILAQTYEDFEFIIVDDGSTDESGLILAEQTDDRIRVLRLQENQGIPVAVQRGIEMSSGKYIARMDSDDVALSTRLEKQLAFLESFPEVGVVGAQRRYLDAEGNVSVSNVSVPCGHNRIVWSVFLGASFWNSSTVIRREVLDEAGGYDSRYLYASDLELWTRLIFRCRFANLPDHLLDYRVHGNNTSQRWRELGPVPPPRTNLASELTGKEVPLGLFNTITGLLYSDARSDRATVEAANLLLIRLYSALMTRGAFLMPYDDVACELMRNVTRLASRAPESPARAAALLLRESAIGVGRRGRRLFSAVGEDSLGEFIRDRSTGNKPLL